MPLPKIEFITYDVNVPSTKEQIKIRPFLVKEQKILLTALAGEDSLEMSNAMIQVVNNCIVTPGVDVNKLTVFDLEYLMLQLRIVSVGENTKLAFYGIPDAECEECRKERVVDVNLKKVQVDFSQEKETKVEITDSIGAILKYPSHKILAQYNNESDAESAENQANADIKLMWSCIESVYDGENVTSTKDISLQEGIEFIESLSTSQYDKLQEFIDGMPKLSHKITLKCSSCDYKESTTIEGLKSFLA